MALFTVTADRSHSAHSEKCLIFPAQTLLGLKHALAVLKEPASLLPPQMSGPCWWQKGGIFPVWQIIPQHQDSQGKRKIWALPSLLWRIFALLPSSSAFTGNYLSISRAGMAHARWEWLMAEGGADTDLKRNCATWEKCRRGENRSLFRL